MPLLQKTIALFAACFVLAGCHDPNALYEQIEAYNDESTTDGASPLLPTPTSGTSTGTTGTNTTAEETGSPIGDFPTEDLVDVTIAVSHSEITQARSVVVTTTSVGADVVELIVRQQAQEDVHIDLPPLGEHKLEYQVVKPGDVEFEVVAQGNGGLLSEVAHLAVYMPAPGSVERVLGEQGQGAAIVLRSETGAHFDQPILVGNNVDGDVVFLGEPSPFVAGGPMEVTSAAVNDQGDVFVGGLAGDDGVVRKYSNRNLLWSYPVHSAVVHDLAVVPDGVMVVGATVENGVTNAAYWSFTESGGLLDHEVWTAQTEQNEPLDSSIHSVVVDIDQTVLTGWSEVERNNKRRQRAAVFTGEGNSWGPCFSHVHENDDVTSAWLGSTGAQDGFVAVGFEQIGEDPPKVARATFNWDCELQDFWVNTGPSGRGVAAGPSTLAGSTILNDHEYEFVSSSSPSWEFTGGLGEATGLVIDRHGYVHLSGTAVFEGVERMSLLSFHP